MRILLFVLRVSCLVPWVFMGLITVSLICPFLSLAKRRLLNKVWSRILLKICGVQVIVRQRKPIVGATLCVANHISWVDIFVLNSIQVMSFIAKSEIRSWPIIGRLVADSGTLFIERGNKGRDVVHGMMTQMEQRFQWGEAVAFFPEGTTSDGLDLLPFRGSLFEAARQMDVPIQPIALCYYHKGKRSGFAAYIGDESLVHNIWRLLGETQVKVEVFFLDPIRLSDIHNGQLISRHELAKSIREQLQVIVTQTQ